MKIFLKTVAETFRGNQYELIKIFKKLPTCK
jgi:hypothetical protein